MRWWKCLLACCNSKIIEENFQLDGKPSENDQGEAIKEAILWCQKTSCLCYKIQAAPKSKET